jgi:hypothetical protein
VNVDTDEVNLTISNYPAGGAETMVIDVGFGPVFDDMQVLITVSGVNGDLAVTIGNGPPTDRLGDVLPNILRELADIIEDSECF